MAKFIVTINQDNIDDIVVEADDPTYDGPETNIEDAEGVYHVEADTEDEAIDTARWIDSIGNPAYSEPSESEYM